MAVSTSNRFEVQAARPIPWQGDFSAMVVARGLLTPCVAFAVALVSADSTSRHLQPKT